MTSEQMQTIMKEAGLRFRARREGRKLPPYSIHTDEARVFGRKIMADFKQAAVDGMVIDFTPELPEPRLI